MAVVFDLAEALNMGWALVAGEANVTIKERVRERAYRRAVRRAIPQDRIVALGVDRRDLERLVGHDQLLGWAVDPDGTEVGEDFRADLDTVLADLGEQAVRTLAAELLGAFVRTAIEGSSPIMQLIYRELVQLRRYQDDGPAADEFERRYLQQVVATLGGLELFGVSEGRVLRTHPFDQAYVSLAVARSGRYPAGDHDEDDDELTGAGVEVTSGLMERPRVLLRGDAGAGKTTLLRWLAVSCRPGTPQTEVWGPAVPFIVALRDVRPGELPMPERMPEMVAGVLAGEMPRGWATAQFKAGRALLLVDGIDELTEEQRPAVRRWLHGLVTAYPDTRVVVSARPLAISEDWPDELDFETFDLQPLSPEGIEVFLAVWHAAARDEYPGDEDMQAWLEQCERGLSRILSTRAELRRLASNPLLCGLLCTLHRRNMDLPLDRKGIYDAALDWLLVRWDTQRGVSSAEGRPQLSREEQTVLLQRFAYSMVKNRELVVPRTKAARRIEHAMRGLRSRDEDKAGANGDFVHTVIERTLVRTGLLREPRPDDVQFVHRTFRDFLAAKEVVDSGDLQHLVDHAHLDHWYDVVVNAVAHARPDERDWLLRALLEGNAAAREDLRLRSRLRLIAAACLPYADVLDRNKSGQTRQLIREAAQQLIPPARFDEAEALAKAGPFVLDLLPGPEGLTPHQAACVIRTVAIIGGTGIWERLAEFAAINELLVIDELLRAWRPTPDPENYAETILADVDFGDRRVEVRNWHRVRYLSHLKHLTNVVCYGDFADLAPLAAVPRLRQLELVQNELVRDLRPLTACPTLRKLVLTTGCQFLRDLSPLAGTGVEELVLYLIKANLETLRGVPLRSLTIRDPRIDGGLDALPADLPLRELIIDNLPQRRDLRGIERWPQLEHVSIKGQPRPDELEALSRLPALRHLTLRGTPTLPNLDGRYEAVAPGARAAGCRPFTANRLVKTRAGSMYYPDVMVACGKAPDRMYETSPTFIVEVLSRSTATIDRREKALAYTAIESLRMLLLVDPEYRRIEAAWLDDSGGLVWDVFGPGDVVVTGYGDLDVERFYDEIDATATTN